MNLIPCLQVRQSISVLVNPNVMESLPTLPCLELCEEITGCWTSIWRTKMHFKTMAILIFSWLVCATLTKLMAKGDSSLANVESATAFLWAGLLTLLWLIIFGLPSFIGALHARLHEALQCKSVLCHAILTMKVKLDWSNDVEENNNGNGHQEGNNANARQGFSSHNSSLSASLYTTTGSFQPLASMSCVSSSPCSSSPL